MKALRFLPFCFIADVHGFSLLAPYLVLFLVFVHVLVAIQRRRAASIRVTTSARAVLIHTPELSVAIA
jgi:hypothetical protein